MVNLLQPHHIDKRIVVENDQKRSLQELLVKSGLPANKLGSVLTYVPVSSTQGDGQQSYTQAIHLFGRRLSIGRGKTKVGAGQNAAQKLLSILKKNGNTTCVILRLAKAVSDEETVEKAERVRQSFCTTIDVPSSS